jgi:hypothetical protein
MSARGRVWSLACWLGLGLLAYPVALLQVFSSKALAPGSVGYWLLIVLVGSIITLSVLVMLALVVFESYRAMKFATLYTDIRWVRCSPHRTGVFFPCGRGESHRDPCTWRACA